MSDDEFQNDEQPNPALEEMKQRLAKLEEETAIKDAELSKLRAKDNNLTDFRKKSEAEKKEIVEKMTERERMIFSEVEELKASKEALEKEHREYLVRQFAGGNVDKEKLIDEEVTRLEKAYGAPRTTSERQALFSDARAIVENREKRMVNPINQTYTPTSDFTEPFPRKKKQNFSETDDGKAIADLLGMKLEDPKKAA